MIILSNFPTQCFLTFCQLRSFCGLRVEKRRKSLLGLTCKTCKRVLFSPSATTANAKMKGQVTFFCSSLKDKREDGAADMLLLFALESADSSCLMMLRPARRRQWTLILQIGRNFLYNNSIHMCTHHNISVLTCWSFMGRICI